MSASGTSPADTTVFLVYEGEYDARYVTAVHATLDGAKGEHRRLERMTIWTHLHGHLPEWGDDEEGDIRCRFSVKAPELPIYGRRFCDFAIAPMQVQP